VRGRMPDHVVVPVTSLPSLSHGFLLCLRVSEGGGVEVPKWFTGGGGGTVEHLTRRMPPEALYSNHAVPVPRCLPVLTSACALGFRVRVSPPLSFLLRVTSTARLPSRFHPDVRGPSTSPLSHHSVPLPSSTGLPRPLGLEPHSASLLALRSCLAPPRPPLLSLVFL